MVGGDGHWHTEVSNPASKEGLCHGCCRDVCQWDNFRPARKAVELVRQDQCVHERILRLETETGRWGLKCASAKCMR